MAKRQQTFQRAARKRKAAQRARAASRVEYVEVGGEDEAGQEQPQAGQAAQPESAQPAADTAGEAGSEAADEQA